MANGAALSGVLIDSMMLRDEVLQKHLDGMQQRGELPKPLTVGDLFDFSLLKGLR